MSKRGRKWEKYAEQHGLWVGGFMNRAIKATLKTGIEVLVQNTHMDSGRAAVHWMIVPNKDGPRTGSRKHGKFRPEYGDSPVGYPGEKGRMAPQVVSHVTMRETVKVIDRSVQGRRPATIFRFYNATPVTHDDTYSGITTKQNYHVNARLEEAKNASLEAMSNKLLQFWSRGQYVRKVPL